ncbi:Alpha/Beta hydrolase protein [Aspergillus germanicus]
MRLSPLLSSWALCVLGALARNVPGRPLVDLGYSKYRGIQVSAEVDQFLAAKPTLLTRRWFDPVCIAGDQNAIESQAENCLFINVFTPSGSNKTSKLPVWNPNANYNGTETVTESGGNIVLVNFNYRVGALGFLAGDALRKHGDHNVGLLDQGKALEWVQRHIPQFGGDLEHVVIHSASAGAGSVAYHLTAHGGRDDGLFVGAISQSPYLASVFAPTGTPTAETYIASLVWVPVIDGDLIRSRRYTAFEDGRFIRVPLMVGGVTDEGSAFAYNATSQDEVTQFTESLYPTLRSAHLKSINNAYPRFPPVPRHAAYFPTASAILTDVSSTCPGLEMTRTASLWDSTMS